MNDIDNMTLEQLLEAILQLDYGVSIWTTTDADWEVIVDNYPDDIVYKNKDLATALRQLLKES